MQRQSRLYPLALSIVLAVFALTPISRVKADDDQDGSIVGTWIVKIQLGPGFDETELTAINPSGTFTLTGTAFNPHTSQNPFLPPFLAVDLSDGYGSWKRLGDSDRFALTFERLLFAGSRTPTDLYGPFFVGQSVGEATIQAVGTLHHGDDGDTLEGPFTFQLKNLNGVVVGTGSGTASFTRLKIEPLATP
jgi:hypothetical protein